MTADRAVRESIPGHVDTLADLIRRPPGHAGAVALVGPGVAPLTHGDLELRIQEWVGVLNALGVGRGDRVAVVLPDGPATAVASLGIASAATCAPLNPAFRRAEFEAHLTRIRPIAVLTDSDGPAGLREAAGSLNLPVWTLVERGFGPIVVDGRPLDRRVDAGRTRPDDIALLLPTSGTSSAPKMVPLTHRNVCVAARGIGATLELSGADRCLNVMPLFHIHGLSVLYASLATGGSVVCPPGFDSRAVVQWIRTYSPTWYSAAPSIHRMILDEVRGHPDLAGRTGLRLVRSASAPMPRQWIDEIESTLGIPFIEAYGMTEAGPLIASNRLPPDPRKPGSVGRAAGPEVVILDAGGQPVAAGETGEVAIRGANVMSAYEADPEANLAAFVGGWLRTGDCGYLDSEGHLFITGRIADVINRGGEKFSPREIEEVLREHPGVAEAVAFSTPHPVLGQNVAAVVVPRRSATESSAVVDHGRLLQELRERVAARLAHFKAPQPILVANAIPTGAGGKIRRRELARHFGLEESGTSGKGEVLNGTTGGSWTPAQRRVALLWSEVLPAAPRSPGDNFFQLGGHSLSATRVLSRIREAFHVELPVDCLFEHPTVGALTDEIGRRLASLVAAGEWCLAPASSSPSGAGVGDLGALPPLRRRDSAEPAPLSFAQQRLWFLDRIDAGPAYHMSASLRLSGPLDRSALDRALQCVRERHEVLRTVYPVVDGSPVQRVLPATPEPLSVLELKSPTGPEREAEARLIAADDFDRTFDLAGGPLVRMALVALSPTDHLLLVTLHHILFDGWSTGIFFRELTECYRAAVVGVPPALPAMEIQYSDFAVWQRQWMQGPAMARHLEFWRGQLRGAPLLCTVPADRPRPAVQTQRGASICRQVPPSVVDRLRVVGQDEGATLFMTVLAGFQALLGVYSGQDDCLVGTPVANRAVKGVEGLLGFFANTLVLRTDLSGDPEFTGLLRRVRRTALDAFSHQDVPFEKLVDELHVERDLGRMPFFQVMFVFQNLPEAAGAGTLPADAAAHSLTFAGGVTARRLPPDRHAAKFDLTLYLEESGRGLQATWLYNADLFDASTIGRIADHFEAVLERMAANPRRPLSVITRLPESEERRLASSSERPSVEPLPYYRQVERVAAATPSAEALVCGADRLTYGELNVRANQLARRLRREGVGTNGRVGIFLDRSVHALVALLAVSKAGGAFVGLDPAYPAERTRWMLDDAAVSVVITERDRASVVASGARVVLCLEDLGSSLGGEEGGNLEAVAGSDLAYVIYTSGSTGHPKGVMISHSNLGHYVQAMRETLGVTPADRYLHTASLGFSSSVRQFAVPWCAGAAVVVSSVAELRDPQALFELILAERVTLVDLVPSYWRSCHEALKALAPGVKDRLLANELRLLLSASEPLPSQLPRELRALMRRNVRMLNLFGQTETTGIVTAHEISPDGPEPGPVVALGRPIPGMRCYLLDAHGRLVPEGVTGEIHVAGPDVALGYLNQPESTASPFLADPFGAPEDRMYRTGDLGRRRSDGQLEFLGRRDLQLKVRGVRVEPGEIEAVLREDPRVGLGVVVAAGRGDGVAGSGGAGTRLAAFVERTTGGPPPSGDPQETAALASELRSLLQRKLPAYMVPAFISVVEHLPRTTTGKLDRAALVRRAGEAAGEPQAATVARASQGRYTAPRTPEEQCLAGVWQSVLRVERVGVDDNFFDLGGDSLLSVQVVLRAREAGLDLDLRQHFRNQTLSALSRAGLSFTAPESASSSASGSGSGAPQTTTAAPPAAVVSDPGGVLVTVESLREFGREALGRAGLNPEGVVTVTEVQLEASLRGQPTHHMDSIPRYARRLVSGALNPNPRIRVERESAISAAMDGDNGPGQWVAMVAMRLAIQKAQSSGMGMVTVRRSNHLGAAGHYAWEAARLGLIGLCTTNGPVILAPTGGVTPTFGNNPLGVGIPAGNQLPVLLDIAMSVAPRGKIALQVARGQPLPPGWILDRQGRPSTDLADLAAGLGVPIGGHKGYGLAMILEILSGVLSGSGFGRDHGRELLRNYSGAADFGHFFLVLDPERFLPRGEFLERVDRLISQTKAGALAEGSREILIPGESELRARERSLREGVRLGPEVHRRLVQYAIETGLQSRLVELEAPRG